MKVSEHMFWVVDSTKYVIGDVVRDTNGRVGEVIAIVGENYIRVRWDMNTTING